MSWTCAVFHSSGTALSTVNIDVFRRTLYKFIIFQDLRRVSTERDSLRSRVKAVTDQASLDRANLEKKCEEMRRDLTVAQTQQRDLSSQTTSLNKQVNTLKDKVNQLNTGEQRPWTKNV